MSTPPETPPSPAQTGLMRGVSKPVFFWTAGITALFVIACVVAPLRSAAFFKHLQGVIVADFGWFYLLSVAIFLLFTLLLRPQIADHGRQEQVVRNSGLDWSLVQPVYLTDGEEPAVVSGTGDIEGMKVSRRALGGVLADLAERSDGDRRSVAVSGAAR